MVLYGVRLMINIFDLFIYRRFLEVFIGKRKTTMEFSIFLLIVCEIMGSIINQLGINWLNFITLLFILSVYICQYEAKATSKAVAILLYMGLMAIAEPIGYVVYQIFLSNYIKNENVIYYFVAIFVEFFRALMVELFCRLKAGKNIRISILPKEIVYALLVIPSASLVGCCLIIEIASCLISEQLIILCMCIIFLIFTMNYIVFNMIYRYTLLEESRHEEEILLNEISYNKEYYQDMEKYQEQIQDIKHDMKNRLAALYDLVKEEQGGIVKEKLSEMLGDIYLAEDIIYSANPVLNSILKNKVSKAKDNGIEVSINTFIPKRMSVEVGDMGVIYGNLLDNALEACGRVEDEKRFIDFETKYQDGKLLVVIRNSKPDETNPEFKTTKKDKRIHGRGIRAIRKMAERYGGNLLLEDEGKAFKATLLLTGVACLE